MLQNVCRPTRTVLGFIVLLSVPNLSCNQDSGDSYSDYEPTPYKSAYTPEMAEENRKQMEEINEWLRKSEQEKKDYALAHPDCPHMGRCRIIDVYAQYMLPEDFGIGHALVIEAFDNPVFKGKPKHRSVTPNFDASKVGAHMQTVLEVEPGAYFIRTYLTDDKDIVPYEYEGMELVGFKPLGVYGVLSAVKTLTIQPKDDIIEPMLIQLDTLFQPPETEVDNKAFLRLLMSTEEEDRIRGGSTVRIGLYRDNDFAKVPAVSLTMVSDKFLVKGAEGRAEFISGNLPLGKYYLLVYIDENDNGYYDEREPAQMTTRAGKASTISIRRERTETVRLDLSSHFEMPK